jgi:hypothetical protein
MMSGIFNVVEELVGTYPSANNLRNAVHAIITQSVYSRGRKRTKSIVGSRMILNNVDYIARNYESARGTHQHLNGLPPVFSCCDTN